VWSVTVVERVVWLTGSDSEFVGSTPCDGASYLRRSRVPDANLDRANGSVGICGHDSTYVFVVVYPFVSLVARELYDLGGGGGSARPTSIEP
jgi:hypothetical protein